MTIRESLQRYQTQIIAALVWCIVFSVYLTTMSNTVSYIDSGELATVATTLGIAHPTGYPLFTLLSRLFSTLPIADEVIVRLNVFSALLTSIAAVIFFLIVIEILNDGKNKNAKNEIIASVFATLALAFSKTFWLQSASIEVYSLHLVLICLTLLIFVKAVNGNEARWWILFAFIVGLAFANHLTTILIAPALLYWFFAEHGVTKLAFKKMLALSIPFAAGISVYLYLPIRASQQPLLNWGNPQTPESFFWHVTGKQFRIWMFSSGDVARKQLNYFFDNLQNEFHAVILIFAVVGSVMILFSNRKKFIVILLLFISCVAYSVNYDIHDIDAYFLLAYLSLSVFAAFGIGKFFQHVENVYAKTGFGILLAGVLTIQWFNNKTANDQSANSLVDDYTNTILMNLPQNAIVLSSQWDYFISASYYFQHVRNVRPDITVLDKELFRRSWYFTQLELMYPDLMSKSKTESELFKQELYKFEHDLPYEYASIEGRYTALLQSFIRNNPSRKFYVSFEIEQQYTSGWNRVPEGFLQRLSREETYIPTQFPHIQFRDFTGTDVYSVSLKGIMTNYLRKRGEYEHIFGYDSIAALYFNTASEITSKFPPMVSNY